MLNESPDAKHLKKTKSSGVDGKVIGRKIVNDCIMNSNKRKKHFPSILLFHRQAKTRPETCSEILSKIRQERSSSLNKIFHEKIEKPEILSYLSPAASFRKRKESNKKRENKLEKNKETLKVHKKTENLSIKEKIESVKILNEKLKQSFGKTAKKKSKDFEKYLKKNKKIISSPRSEKKYKESTEETKLKEHKKLHKRLSGPENILIKKPKKPEEKPRLKKSPGRKTNEDLKKKKKLKKKNDLFKTVKVESLFKLEKSYKSRYSKKRKIGVNFRTKRSEATSSTETFRKKYSEKDSLQNDMKLKTTKTEFNLDNIHSSETCFKGTIESYDLEDSLIVPLKSAPTLDKDRSIEDTGGDSIRLPKKVEKIPIEAFVSILKSKHPSISIAEPSENFKDSLEEQESIINCNNSQDSVQMVSNLDISIEKQSQDQSHEKTDSESSLSSSSIYSNPDISITKTKENKLQFFLSEPGFSDSESSVPEKPLSFDEEVAILIKSEISMLLKEVCFADRVKEVDSSKEYLENYLKTLEKKIESVEGKFLNSVNSPFLEEPHLKLERIQLAETGSFRPVFLYENLLPAELETQDLLKSSNCENEATYHKFLLDVINEALNHVRPFAFQGFPDPWSTRFDMMFGESKSSVFLTKAKKILMDWDSVRSGPFFFEDDESLLKERDERLKVKISQIAVQEDPCWTQYDFEETQVKIELSYLAFDFLIEELTSLV